MSTFERYKDNPWKVSEKSYDSATLCVLMDIRDELKELNRTFNCTNFTEMPKVLRDIRQNTTKPRRPKK